MGGLGPSHLLYLLRLWHEPDFPHSPRPLTERFLTSLLCPQRAAAVGITQVVISRITMAAPGMSKMENTSYLGGTLEYLAEASVPSAFKWEVGCLLRLFPLKAESPGKHRCS